MKRATFVATASGIALCGVVTAIFFDVPITTWVHEHQFSEAAKQVLRVIRWPGNYFFSVGMALVLFALARTHWRLILTMLASGALASGLTLLLKVSFGRVRPFKGRGPFDWRPFNEGLLESFAAKNLSFPSGDATLAFATAAVVAQICPRLAWFAFGWAILVGITRVMQGAHYPSDVCGGALVGVCVSQIAVAYLSRTTFEGSHVKEGPVNEPGAS